MRQEKLYKGTVSNQQAEGHYRRNILLMVGLGGLGLGLSAVIPNPARDSIINMFKETTPNRYPPKVLKGEDGKVYFQARVLDEDRVFVIEYTRPEEFRGVERLVESKNPHYNNAEKQIVGNFALQLYGNPAFDSLEVGKLRDITPKRKIPKFIYPDLFYPIPKEIGKGTLEKLVLQK